MSLGAAIATFCSSNKAGSIPLFTQHLNTNPNDYTALMWRGRAYSIIGDYAKAIADFVKAASVTDPPRKDLAQAECEFLSGNVNQGIAILYSVVKNYPDCAEAYSWLGKRLRVQNPEAAFENLNKAVNLGKSNGETSEPWYPWANYHLGDICYDDGRIDLSSEYYDEAIRTCSSLTVAHLGSSRCDILRNNTAKAKASFEVAKKLNPTLVKWANFNDFRSDVVIESKGRVQASGAVRKGGAGGGGGGGRSSEGGGGAGSSGGGGGGGRSIGGRGGGRDKKGGDGSGGESDTDEDRGRKGIRTKGLIDGQTAQLITNAMEKVKKEAPAIKEFNDRKYYQSKDGKYWYVKDTAGHAGALLKKYKDRRSSLEFVGSMTIDKDGNLVDIDPEKKHESNKIPFIEKSKMKTCK